MGWHGQRFHDGCILVPALDQGTSQDTNPAAGKGSTSRKRQAKKDARRQIAWFWPVGTAPARCWGKGEGEGERGSKARVVLVTDPASIGRPARKAKGSHDHGEFRRDSTRSGNGGAPSQQFGDELTVSPGVSQHTVQARFASLVASRRRAILVQHLTKHTTRAELSSVTGVPMLQWMDP
jgi:hypothetical protein